MPLALITGAARANSIAAGVVPRLAADGWDVATSDLADVDFPCDLSTQMVRRRWSTRSVGPAARSGPSS